MRIENGAVLGSPASSPAKASDNDDAHRHAKNWTVKPRSKFLPFSISSSSVGDETTKQSQGKSPCVKSYNVLYYYRSRY